MTLDDVSIENGWKVYLENCGEARGWAASPLSRKRDESIRDRHVPWCQSKGITFWRQFECKVFQIYGNWMFKNYAYRTCSTALTQVKSVVKFLIDEQRLPEGSRIVYKLQKPEGSDTYCPRPVEVRAMIDYCLADPDFSGVAGQRIIHHLASSACASAPNGRATGGGDVDLRTGVCANRRRAGQQQEDQSRDRPDNEGAAFARHPDSPGAETATAQARSPT